MNLADIIFFYGEKTKRFVLKRDCDHISRIMRDRDITQFKAMSYKKIIPDFNRQESSEDFFRRCDEESGFEAGCSISDDGSGVSVDSTSSSLRISRLNRSSKIV